MLEAAAAAACACKLLLQLYSSTEDGQFLLQLWRQCAVQARGAHHTLLLPSAVVHVFAHSLLLAVLTHNAAVEHDGSCCRQLKHRWQLGSCLQDCVLGACEAL